MKLTEMDRKLIEATVTERIDQHCATHREETKADREQLARLDARYWEVLETLSEEDADAIHEFHDHSFWLMADEEKTLYKSGVLDGLRLAKIILELE